MYIDLLREIYVDADAYLYLFIQIYILSAHWDMIDYQNRLEIQHL